MVRVLVVDDEKEIRKGLVTQLPWAEWGVDEVLDADDGDTALELAKRCVPDLIVTDIRMPRMSGLQLIEDLVRSGYDGSLIVISGYDDFHYAKDAFKMGVSDYLLKPISKDELSKAVAFALQRMRERQALEQNRSMLQQGYESAIPKIREELLRELTEQPYRESQALRIEHKLEQLKLGWLPHSRLRPVVFGIDSLKAITGTETPSDKDALLAAMGERLELYFQGKPLKRYVLFRSRSDDWIALFGESEGFGFADIDALSAEACERVSEKLHIRISRGCADASGSVRELSEMCRRAVELLAHSKVSGSSAASEEQEPDGDERADDPLSSAKGIVELMKYGTQQDVREALGGFPKLVKSWNVRHPKDLQQRTFEWLLDVFRTAQRTAGWKENAWERNPIVLWEHLERFDTLESLQQQVIDQLLKASESIKVQSDSRSQIVHEAMRIIRQRFQENLTLQTVAEQVHVTPVWLSKLFKKETEMNFLEYITDVRMQKATELLADLTYKVYQISFLVGYQDPVHFSKLFKRKYGCTPQEYRNSRGSQHA
ncbi:response regulator [Paenibacillus sp.]|uniref:response regulator transcription factor n=1 Tax=Paenibacillus sp. TaxID=58172 RepID=UPI002811A891|nr:response regulator [Paenibacillus sp.]